MRRGETRWDEPPQHKHTPTHRKNFRRDHEGNTITVKDHKGDPWHMAKDPKSGKSYWYNEATKESSWTDPHAAADGGAAEPPAHEDVATHRASYRKNHRGKHIKIKDSDGNHWHMAKDPHSGRTYWYNEQTKQSSWTDPQESVVSYAQPELQ